MGGGVGRIGRGRESGKPCYPVIVLAVDLGCKVSGLLNIPPFD